MELEGIEAAITAPNVILHYGWQDMPINNIQQFRVRFSFVNESLGKWKKGLAIANFMLKLKTNNYG